MSDQRLADFADAVLELAAKLDLRSPELRGLVPLTGAEVTVMREIHRHPRCSPSQIAERIGMKRSNVSTVVRSLEVGGLVVREHPASDARSVQLVPTELASQSVARIKDYWSRRLRQLPEELLADGVAAIDTLERIAAAVTVDRPTDGGVQPEPPDPDDR